MKTSTVHQPKQLTGKLLAVLVLLGISVFINYIDRGNLSIAAPMLKDELRISATQLGILLSAFFWTYACLQPIAGWLVDRVNVNWVIAGGFFLWSAATAATGLVRTFSMPATAAEAATPDARKERRFIWIDLSLQSCGRQPGWLLGAACAGLRASHCRRGRR